MKKAMWKVKGIDEKELNFLEKVVKKYYGGRAEDYEFEFALVKEDNEHGFISYGWPGENKIVILNEWTYEPPNTVKKLRKFLIAWNRKAQVMCDALNKEES